MEGIVGTAVSVAGHSHVKNAKPCQDSSLFWGNRNYSAVVVCDGHGGEKHFRSNIGAGLAVEVCRESAGKFVNGVTREKEVNMLPQMIESYGKHIVFSWREKTMAHYEQNPFTYDELSDFSSDEAAEISLNPYIAYGTTLLFSIITKKNCFLIKLGDGEIRVKHGDEMFNCTPAEEEFMFGRTDSLCNSNASEKIKYSILDNGDVSSVIITSDGVYNSFNNNDSFERFVKIIDSNGNEMNELAEMLKSSLTELSYRGSGDDMSVAILKRYNQK